MQALAPRKKLRILHLFPPLLAPAHGATCMEETLTLKFEINIGSTLHRYLVSRNTICERALDWMSRGLKIVTSVDCQYDIPSVSK
jgi:hypothetical protein